MILWSGGLDCVALGIVLRGQGLKLTPIYGMHRANGGGTTRHELDAAALLAEPCLGQELLIARGAGPIPNWLWDLGVVLEVPRRLLPIPSGPRKEHRNRIMLKVVEDLRLDFGVVAVGTLGYEAEAVYVDPGKLQKTPRERIKDISHAELVKHTSAELVTPESLGLGKADLIREACRAKRGALELLSRSWSCRGYFRKHCGGCGSCRSRVQAFMEAVGEDRTVYKPGSWAARYRGSLRRSGAV